MRCGNAKTVRILGRLDRSSRSGVRPGTVRLLKEMCVLCDCSDRVGDFGSTICFSENFDRFSKFFNMIFFFDIIYIEIIGFL